MKTLQYLLTILILMLTSCSGQNPPDPYRKAAYWMDHPLHGTVVEIGYGGGPDELRNPPYPSVASLKRLKRLGVDVVTLEFQFVWSILPPYRADEKRFKLLTNAVANFKQADLKVILSCRNGPGRNGMMPDIKDKDVITTLYTDPKALEAYQAMLRDLVRRFRDDPAVLAWEPMVEPAFDHWLTHEEDAPYVKASAIWNRVAPTLVAAIRAEDAERPILLETVNWSGAHAFERFKPVDDPNIIYDLHTYEPYDYTSKDEPPYSHYPGTTNGEHIDKAWLNKLLHDVDAFQARYHVPIVVGEWGGIRWIPDMDRYIADQIDLFARRKWSWFWYAWDDEEWEEYGFQLQLGADRKHPKLDVNNSMFAPIVRVWQGD